MKSKEMGKPVCFHARFDGQVGCHDWMKNYDLIIVILSRERLKKSVLRIWNLKFLITKKAFCNRETG